MAAAGTPKKGIIWEAAIDDKTAAFFTRFNANINAASKNAMAGFTGIGTSSARAGTQIGLIAGVAATVSQAFLRMAADVARAFREVVAESIKIAARVEELGVILLTVGRNAGYSQSELERLVEQIRAIGVTAPVAYDLVLKMMQANLDLSKAVDLARVALDAATISEMDSSEALTRMIHGIVTLNPLILRRTHLYVDMDSAYKDANISVTELSSSTNIEAKQAAVLNAVLRQGARIAGSYEAAMETAGKRARSLTRFMQDLEIELGRAFQPAYLEWINFLIDALVDTRDWFREDADAVEDFGRRLGLFVGDALSLLKGMANALEAILSGIIALETKIVLIGKGVEDKTERVRALSERLGQATVLWVRMFVWQAAFLTEIFKNLANQINVVIVGIDLLWKVSTKANWIEIASSVGELITAFKELGDQTLGASAAVQEAADAATLATAEWLGLSEQVGDAAKEGADEVVDAMRRIAEETEDVLRRIDELNDAIAEEMAELAIRWERQLIEAAIRESRRREDLYRNHLKRLDRIRYNYERRKREILRDIAEDEKEDEEERSFDRIDAARDHADDLLDIEIEYSRDLEDIKRRTEEDIREAARSNDAVAIARLMRRVSRQVKEAKIGRDRDIEDAERNYKRELRDIDIFQKRRREREKKDRDRRLHDLEEDLEEQLKLAEEQRKDDLDNLARYLKRAEEDRTRHRDWDEEDVYRRHEDEFKALGKHFAQVEWLEESHMKWLLERRGQYIKDDLGMLEAYYAERRRMATQGRYGYDDEEWGGPSYEEDDYYGQWQGYARGGMGIATRRTRIVVGEEEPEMFAAIPLSAIVTHNINLSGNLNINGVSPQMEQQVAPAVLAILQQFGQQLLAGTGAS